MKSDLTLQRNHTNKRCCTNFRYGVKAKAVRQ